MLSGAGMTYRMTTADDKLYVAADANHLVRVYENLISNAIRYGSESKYVDIRTERENNEVIVKIINYGAPIEEDDLPYLFERFYRAEKSRSSKTGGRGLDLQLPKASLTYMAAVSMSGAVKRRLYSRPNFLFLQKTVFLSWRNKLEIVRTFTRIYLNDLDRVLPFYEKLYGTEPGSERRGTFVGS
ncbi:ATP-binding protein [Paenibacillus larvae]|nr:ATP-binding protein [Paenibacillus larvae]MDT2254866.1 ATP-binding protein [Paenibacillus larvae]MDT2260954.1 ATP-binding protein [Paenibacillus larvae]MDT2276550.1 ATP-binding protein [Paenibacillus larvae]MDT2293557.1 ATP-binding protein [Paenibacillus larvae]MDT2305289.1 ATP-binding protein [Paenibacillus larvae]